jgi:hypothetical protein
MLIISESKKKQNKKNIVEIIKNGAKIINLGS